MRLWRTPPPARRRFRCWGPSFEFRLQGISLQWEESRCPLLDHGRRSGAFTQPSGILLDLFPWPLWWTALNGPLSHSVRQRKQGPGSELWQRPPTVRYRVFVLLDRAYASRRGRDERPENWRWSAVERIQHDQDSQGQILALAFRSFYRSKSQAVASSLGSGWPLEARKMRIIKPVHS